MVDVNLLNINTTTSSGWGNAISLSALGTSEPQHSVAVEIIVKSPNIAVDGWPQDVMYYLVQDSNDGINWHTFAEGATTGGWAKLEIPNRIHLDNLRVYWEKRAGISLNAEVKLLGR